LKVIVATAQNTSRSHDDWQQLKDYVAERSGRGRAFGPHRDLTLSILIERARLARRSPHQLEAAWLQDEYDALRNERRKGFMRALVFFNELVTRRAVHPTLGNILPSDPVELPRGKRGPRYGGATLPESFHEDVERFIAFYLTQGRTALVAGHLGKTVRSKESAKSYRSAISWLVRELLKLGIKSPDDIKALADICRESLLRPAAGAYWERGQDDASHLREEATSLHTYVNRISYIARCWLKVSAEELEQLKQLRNFEEVKNSRVGKMGEEREDFARELLRNQRMRTAILHLPETTMREADALLERWHQLCPSERMRCLRLAICGSQTAILLRAMALRATNLRSITFRGKQATLFFKGGAHKTGRVSIPGKQVKNKRKLEFSLPPDCEKIVRRFVEVYRPLLVTAHPYGKNAADSDFLFPGTLVDRPMDASVFAHCFEVGIRSAGLGMTLHMCRHAIATLVLSKDPGRLIMVANWLGIHPGTVRDHYAFLDGTRAAEEGQKHMQELLREARRRAPVGRRS
jgi:hypothetical protein